MPADFSRSQPDFAATFQQVAQRYRGCSRFARGYVNAKLRRDPVHRDVLALAATEAFGEVVDLGCGRGQLALALLEAGLARSVLGLDRNPAHLEQARCAAQGLEFRAALQDLAETQEIPPTTTVLLIDVLYQLEERPQMALLNAAARAARERVLIRTLDPDRGVRSTLTLGLERILRHVSPNSGDHIEALPLGRLARVLAEAGFAVASAPCWKGTPFPTVLLIGRRAG
jgi:SAM-dependent methyltransferase